MSEGKVYTKDELMALPPEVQEAVLINTWAQMILDLAAAARLPVGMRLMAALSTALQTVQNLVREQIGEEEWKKLVELAAREAGGSELYLAHNMKDAVKGGTAKVILK